MTETNNEESLTLYKKTMEVIVAHIIPTSKYFESRFDHMQDQIHGIKDDLKNFRGDIDRRFEEVGKRFENINRRFEEVDKRFEQVDKRFEQVDKRLEQIIASIDRLGDKLDHRDETQRSFTIRMFTIAIAISVIAALGAFLKSMGII